MRVELFVCMTVYMFEFMKESLVSVSNGSKPKKVLNYQGRIHDEMTLQIIPINGGGGGVTIKVIAEDFSCHTHVSSAE